MGEHPRTRRCYARSARGDPRSTDGNPPAILDPFAGGGTIPLEAQRLGLEAHASDLNPVAVLINKALIEIPPKFAGQAARLPRTPSSALTGWPRATGLAEDVRRYGAWMRDEAAKRIGHLYPQATSRARPDGEPTGATQKAMSSRGSGHAPSRARTRPAASEMPLVRSWWLGKKKGKEAYVVPEVVDDASAASGRSVAFRIGRDAKEGPTAENDGTVVKNKGANCIACATFINQAQIRAEGSAGRMGSQLMATVAEGKRQRIYVEPSEDHAKAAAVPAPGAVPDGAVAKNPRWFSPPQYGLTRFADLFTNRQLTTLTTFSDLVSEARERVLKDAVDTGMSPGTSLAEGGTDAEAYADAVATYLGMATSRLADYGGTISTWMPDPKNEGIRNTFARQAIPMTWDFAEANAFSDSSGNLRFMLRGIARVLDQLPATSQSPSNARQADASTRDYSDVVLCTDPPYYDNIGYSDLSDYFYVWLRRSLRPIHPDLFGTMLVPKAEELVANPYRHGGKDKAEEFFETGFEHVFGRARESANPDYPITVFYAFKQAELEKEGVVSTGWSTFLEGMIREGWTITSTWPVRSERGGRMISVGTNALASSIVLSLRPRPADAPPSSRRAFLAALQQELPHALTDVRQGGVAPVDLAQAAIGPGMAIYSRYSAVLEANGSRMPVKTALALINQVLDEVQTEAEGELDADSRFALAWFAQYGWGAAGYGEAEVLAKAMNTSVKGLVDGGVLHNPPGKVNLVRPADLPARWDPRTDARVSVWETTCHLARVLTEEHGGLDAAATLLASASARTLDPVEPEAVQSLAFRLYTLADAKGAPESRAFNALGGSWTELTSVARDIKPAPTQGTFDDFATDEDE